jgi:hypothetical protein
MRATPAAGSSTGLSLPLQPTALANIRNSLYSKGSSEAWGYRECVKRSRSDAKRTVDALDLNYVANDKIGGI